MMKVLARSFVCALVLELTSRSEAHPGAIAEGRGSCGAEFDTAQTAFRIPDIKEGWYVRRVHTCADPFFWVTFDTTAKDQKVTFVSGSPDFAGFADKLNFNAVLFGPGYDRLEIPAALSDWQVKLPSGLGGKVLSSPSSFESCDFVSNPVMSQYKKVTNGRCMEHMTIEKGYKTTGLAGGTWDNWWIANHDLKLPSPGTYYIVFWPSHRGSNKVASGRIEVTMGPWTWGSYAGDATKKQAQAQTTTCSCAINHASWYNQNLDFIGSPSASLGTSQFPFQECSEPGVKSTSSCRASEKAKAIASTALNGSAVEWSGLFDLNAGTYDWNFFAFRSAQWGEWEFPDSTMDVVVVPTSGSGIAALEAVESSADKAMTASIALDPNPSLVLPLGEMAVGASAPVAFRLNLTTPTGSDTTKVTFKLVVPAKGTFAIFTQHRPSEFNAEQLTCTTACPTGSKYVFWAAAKTYGVVANKRTEIAVTGKPASSGSTGWAKTSSATSLTCLAAFGVLLWFSADS